MKGRIIVYSPDVSAGLIKAEDGKQYPFHANQWLSAVRPASNTLVRFKAEPDCAIEVCAESELKH